MARKKSSAAEKKDVESPPELLTQRQRRLYTLLMVLSLVVFAIGSFGLLILFGKHGSAAFINIHVAMP